VGRFLGTETGRQRAQPTGCMHCTRESARVGDGTASAQCNVGVHCRPGVTYPRVPFVGDPRALQGTCRSLLAQGGCWMPASGHSRCLVTTRELGTERAGTVEWRAPCSCARMLPSPRLRFRAGGAGLQWGVPLPVTPRAAGGGELRAPSSAQGPPAAGRRGLRV